MATCHGGLYMEVKRGQIEMVRVYMHTYENQFLIKRGSQKKHVAKHAREKNVAKHVRGLMGNKTCFPTCFFWDSVMTLDSVIFERKARTTGAARVDTNRNSRSNGHYWLRCIPVMTLVVS